MSHTHRPTFDTLEDRRLMANFTVTSTANSGAGTLREAITQANATTAADVINFNIAGSGMKVITIPTSLDVTQPVTIDATTQPGYAGSPLVQVRRTGTSFNDGIQLNASNSVIRGLSVTEFVNGIVVNAANVTIEKSYIGLDPTGAAVANTADGIVVTTAGNFVTIRDNIISGNGQDGVDLSADNARFTGNIIGLDPTGLLARPNAANGIRVTANGDSLTLGDGGDANRNIISGNGFSALRFLAAASNGLIINNYFGLDKTGNVRIANNANSIVAINASSLSIGVPALGNRFGGNGVDIFGNSINNVVTDNVFGVGANPAINVGGGTGISVAGNLNTITNNIVGNNTTGIRVEGSNNTATGNFIGVLPSGQAVGGNTGIWIPSGSSNYVLGNTIANCALNGVQVSAGTNNYFDNVTWANTRSYRIEAIANDSLHQPVISSVSENPSGSYTINVAYLSVPVGTYQIKLYSSDQAGNAASGHTQRLLQTATFTSVGGDATRSYTVTGTPLDSKFITATISEVISTNVFGSTSEPSAAVQALGTPGMAGSAFEFETNHTVRFDFTSVTQSSVGVGDVTIRNLATLQPYSAETMTVSGNTYRWTRNAILPDGSYEAVIPVGAVSNARGTNKSALKLNFHVLAGDANRDGTANFDDLLILAQNYGQTGKTFSQGNFNYDGGGNVNFDDLLIVAQKYGTSLFSDASIAMPVVTRSSRRAPILFAIV